MSNTRDFRLQIDKERRTLVKLERRAMTMQERVFKQRGMVKKMEGHLTELQKLGGTSEHRTGNTP